MSQIPSRASLDARRARDRYAHCPVCSSNDVDGLHVDRCRDVEQLRQRALEAGRAAGIPDATTLDLWAHLRGRVIYDIRATDVLHLVLNLGWRPVVGNDPKRLWRTPTDSPADAGSAGPTA